MNTYFIDVQTFLPSSKLPSLMVSEKIDLIDTTINHQIPNTSFINKVNILKFSVLQSERRFESSVFKFLSSALCRPVVVFIWINLKLFTPVILCLFP